MFRNFILYIQRQPRETRSNYALVGAVMMTTLIAFVWLGYIAVFPEASVYTASVAESRSAETDRAREAAAPFSGFWGQLQEQVAELRSIGEGAGRIGSDETTTDGAATSTPMNDVPAASDGTSSRNVIITHEPATSSPSTD